LKQQVENVQKGQEKSQSRAKWCVAVEKFVVVKKTEENSTWSHFMVRVLVVAADFFSS